VTIFGEKKTKKNKNKKKTKIIVCAVAEVKHFFFRVEWERKTDLTRRKKKK
jgi:hypothetical protein